MCRGCVGGVSGGGKLKGERCRVLGFSVEV